MKKLFVNLGNSLFPSDRPGILVEAQQKFGSDREVWVVALENDRILKEIRLPEGAMLLFVKDDGTPLQEVEVSPDDVFVLNGGMTPQQVAMMVHLSCGCTVGQVVNMQRERCVVMAYSPEVAAERVRIEKFLEELRMLNWGLAQAGTDVVLQRLEKAIEAFEKASKY